ncbi:MAG: SpoIID/LytB domain-containing protein [Clostridiales bacterium]|nr:SpoIID/LytB domain-containing protein [Clostridiales bacterium]
MKRLQALCFAILFVLSALAVPQRAVGESNPVVRVLLSAGTPASLTVTLSGNYTVEKTKVTGGTLTATYTGGKIKVTHSEAGDIVTSDMIQIVREAGAPNTTNARLRHLSGSERAYLGDLVLRPSGAGVQAINHVPMREYLYGVVRAEVGESAHAELLKAQTIISRCFALGEMAARTRQTYDVTDTTSTQVYMGYPPSIPRITAAVDAHYQHTLRYGTHIVKTHYGQANGGVVLTPKTRWGGTTAYENAYQLRYDPFDLRSNANNLTLAIDGRAPEAMNRTLYEYLLSLATAAVSGTATRIVSVSAIQGLDSAGKEMGLPTTSPLQDQAAMKVTLIAARSSGGNVTATVTVNYAALIGRGLSMPGDRNRHFVTQTGDQKWCLAFGLSSGPRVGLSHRGAQQMAALGYSYVDILKFYYPGATLYDEAGKTVAPQKDTSLSGVMTALGLGGGPTPTPTPSSTPEPIITAYGQINASGVNFRSGPSTDDPSMGLLSRNTQVGIYGTVKNSKGETWYYLILPATGQKGYVRSDFITVTAAVTPSPDPTPRPLPTPNPDIVPKRVGDVNGDGEITAVDASLILRWLVQLVALNPAQLTAADVNGDGSVTARDASKILRYLVELDTL